MEIDAHNVGDAGPRTGKQSNKVKNYLRGESHLKNTVLGKLLRWINNSKHKTYSAGKTEVPPKYPPDERVICHGNTFSPTNDDSKYRKRAYIAPTPRSQDSKSSPTTSEAVPEIGKEAVRDLLAHRLNTPHPMTTTPDSIETMKKNCDRYRLMYLIVRAEQQNDHLRDVISSIRNISNRKHYRNMVKIKEAVSKMYGTLLSLRDDDPGAYVRVGDCVQDLGDFFNMVENVCSAVEEFQIEGSNQALEGDSASGMNTAIGIQAMRNPRAVKLAPIFNGTKLYMQERNNLNRVIFQNDELAENHCPPSFAPLKTPWPTLNTNDKGRQQKDRELHTLMTEIDELMVDVGLAGGETEKRAITYEELMSGLNIQKQIQKEGKRKVGWKDETERKTKDKQDSADKFITELDQLLDEADSK